MSIDKRAAEPITTLGFVEGSNLDDSEFTREELESAERVMFEFVSARFPQHDLTIESTLYGLLRPASVIYLVIRRMLETFRATMSLQGIADNPELADEATVSAILSNFLISRSQGSKTRGTIRITVSASRSFRIPAATVFTSQDGLEFVSEAEVLASPGGGVPVVPDGAGNFFFDVPVVAAAVGSVYDSASISQFSVSRTIDDLVNSNGIGDFSGGVDYESVDGLSSRILASLSVRNRISRASVAASLADDAPEVLGSTLLGMGSPLMLRNRDNALGIATGGIVDVYVRTSLAPEIFEVAAVAYPIEDFDGSTYVASVGRDVLPGHYAVLTVRPPGSNLSGTYSIVSQERSINSAGSSKRLPSVPAAAFSRFQETEVTFMVETLDQVSANADDPDALDVVLGIMAPSGISGLQDYFDDPSSRIAGTDYLVRGFVPCMVSTSAITVRVLELSGVTESLVRGAVMSVVHAVPSGEGVRVDSIVSAIRSIPGVVEVDLPILLTGGIHVPAADARVIEFSSQNELLAPEDIDGGYGPDNTVYFTSPDRIGITLQKV